MDPRDLRAGSGKVRRHGDDTDHLSIQLLFIPFSGVRKHEYPGTADWRALRLCSWLPVLFGVSGRACAGARRQPYYPSPHLQRRAKLHALTQGGALWPPLCRHCRSRSLDWPHAGGAVRLCARLFVDRDRRGAGWLRARLHGAGGVYPASRPRSAPSPAWSA